MRSTLLGIFGLAFGVIGALGYSHYLGEGKQLADVQDQLSKVTANLSKATDDSKAAKQESDAMSAQIQQLSSTNEKLKQQVASAASAQASAAATPSAFNPIAGVMVAQFARQNEEKLLLLKSRPHLTPEQEATVKAAMDAESKKTEAIADRMLHGEKMGPEAIHELYPNPVKSVDRTVEDILLPEQKTAYQQMKTDQKNSSAETSASLEMNKISPLLQPARRKKRSG